jgi:hypothetical protein
VNVTASVVTGAHAAFATWASPTARADGAVADYSRDVAGELGVIRSDAERDELDLAGHRVTELRRDEAAA